MTKWEQLKSIVEKHDGDTQWVAEALYAWLAQHSEGEEEFMAALMPFLKGDDCA